MKPGAPAANETLSSRTASGFAWLLSQTVGSRVVSIASQLLLAWFVSETAFGLMALATTAMAATQLVQNIGLREVLIQRSHKVRLWVRDAQHVAMAVGGAAAILMIATAPVFAWMYNEPGVFGVILVLSGAPLFRAMANVSQAVLRAQMRFRTVALIDFLDTFMLAAVAIPLAALGLEAYALAIPVTATALIQLVISDRCAGVRIGGRVRPKRWRMLLRSGGVLAASRVFSTIVQVSDYLLLGLFHPSAVVGVYYFAFNLSMQSMRVLNTNVVGVMLPALSSIANDQRRATEAMLRSLRALALLGVPFAMLQIALVDPLFATLFPGRWEGLGPIVQVLSVGMLFSLVGNSSSSLLMSQRRYATVLWLTAAHAVLAVLAVFPAARYFGAFEVGLAVMVYRVVMAPIWIYVAIRPSGAGWGRVAGVFAGPVSAGLFAAAAGGASGYAATGGWPLTSWLGGVVTIVVALPVYAVLSRALCPGPVKEMIAHLRIMSSRVLVRGRAV